MRLFKLLGYVALGIATLAAAGLIALIIFIWSMM